MNRSLTLCKALGWQGGTIHQVAAVTGVDVATLLYGACDHKDHDYVRGNISNLYSLKYRLEIHFPEYFGNANFWIGVADSKNTY